MKHHEEANKLMANVSVYMGWRRAPDEALQLSINDVFGEASEDARANLYTAIASEVELDGEGWDPATLQKLIETNSA